MKKISIQNEQGVSSIVAIIIGIVALFGVGAAVYYVQNNQSDIEQEVEESRTERAEQAQEDGYPSMWAEANLPEYPDGTLTKTRQGNNLNDGVSATIETDDNPQTVKAFFDGEMTTRGFIVQDLPGNEFVSMATYLNSGKQLSMQAVENENTGVVKIQLNYNE